MDSADKPLDGRRWWLEADEPWQCLAVCEDLTKALRSPEPERYASKLPVHQDGSCNGLQHYAALGRDEVGASQVDLIPAEKPQDVYSGVCRLVQERVAKDAAEGDRLAKMLNGLVDRKVVKQTVMTSVYGVTFIGARQQILNRLKDVGFPEEEIYAAAIYLARTTLNSIGDVFTGADNIKKWLAQCARSIALHSYDVAWVTPLGLPVVQPYRDAKKQSVFIGLQSVTLADLDDQPVLASRQRTAFPPNFVHSLDSTHLLMTANRMGQEDLTFAAVHDSYWTHACDVDRMNTLLREEFVALHSQPLLEDLCGTLRLRYPFAVHEDTGESLFDNPPQKGNLNLERVKESPYFFD